jgi:hypothetical protein
MGRKTWGDLGTLMTKKSISKEGKEHHTLGSWREWWPLAKTGVSSECVNTENRTTFYILCLIPNLGIYYFWGALEKIRKHGIWRQPGTADTTVFPVSICFILCNISEIFISVKSFHFPTSLNARLYHILGSNQWIEAEVMWLTLESWD